MVTLLQHTPDPERVVATAARLCYSPAGIAELSESLSQRDCARLIRSVIAMGHTSVLEHASFQFGVEGVSRALSHQLVRHRHASYSQQSQRYVRAHGFEFVTPPSIAASPDAQHTFAALMGQAQAAYDTLVGAGIPPEDARYVLPTAASTRLVVTMNARSLHNFFKLRTCRRAQGEIRALAEDMLSLCRQAAPLLFEKAGAVCETEGRCDQGTLTCGRLGELRAAGNRPGRED